MSVEDAVTFGILRAVGYLFIGAVVVWIVVSLLEFLVRHFWVIAVLSGLAGMAIWAVKTEPFGPATAGYLIAGLVVGVCALGALAYLYDGLVKLEKVWDRALEARRYRKLQATPPWGPRPPEA
jgi:hypothetical protein